MPPSTPPPPPAANKGMTGPARWWPARFLWLLPALLSSALLSSSHLGASAQEAAPPDGRAQAVDDAMPAPARGLVPGPGRPVGDAAGLGPEVLGDGAVRRTFTAPADGWYRLAARGGHVRWAVTVLGGGSRGVLASSRWEDHLEGGALIHARAGAGLAVLVGALDGPGGGFELAWSGAAAPVRLRPAGRLPDGGRDALGVPVEMRRPGDLAFGAGRLFMASGLGLSAYARDPATGGLALEHLVDADVAGALLAWDEGRSRLLAHDCGRWTAFGVGADGAPGPARAVPADGDPAHCGRPLVDAGGGLVHRAGAGGVDLFSVGPDGGLRYEGTAAVPGLRGAALGGSGEVYAAGAAGLAVVSRRDGSSRPWAAPAGIGLSAPAAARVPLAVGAGGGLLLAADAGGARLFALGGGASPVPLGVLPLASGVGDAAGCAFAALRPGGVADALCGGRLATAQWLGGAAGFAAGSTSAAVGAPVGMAATPDGRRVYVSTPEDGILAFERVPGEGPDSTADDHGDDPATATVVTIPSTTAGELGLGDRDYFRIDIIRAGILTFETTGSTDTYGTLHDGDGTVLEEDDDRGPRPTNFGISDVLLFEGTYFVEVKEVRGVTGAYELRVTGDARSAGKPAATAPSVSINTIPTGNEGTEVRLGATLTGGAYDGAADYAWSVDGGTLDSPSSATPIWTRPAVDSNANHTVRLTVTVRGTGTNAESGTSDSAGANRQALVRDVPPPLPAADAPAVTVNAIPDGNEGTTARLGATLTGGTYDGTPEFAWTVTGGRLSNPNSATPTWTRPTVNADADYAVRLTVTVRGRGTNARSGTSERVNANRTARVLDVPAQLPVAAAPSVSINAVPAGNEGTAVQLGATLNGGTYDGAVDYAWTVTGGTLNDPGAATPTWSRPSVASNTNYTVRLTVTARGAGTAARSGTSDTANTSRTAQVRNVAVVLPVAAAPSVTINAIPAGDENANVQLAATLNGGTYDGAVDYAWTATGGTLDDPAAATPTWTRPSVTSNTNFTVRLTVTARGAGTTARNGTSDTANATFSAQVRNVAVVLPVAAAPSVTINAIPAGDENANVQLTATLNGGTYDGAAEYAWSVNGGTLNDPTLATPTWTRPSVTSNTNHTVSLTITVRGSGATARNGTSDTANTTRTAQVRDTGGTGGDHGNNRASATTVGIPSTTAGTITAGDRDYFRIDVGQAGSLRLQTSGATDTWGTLYGSDGSKITENDDSGPGRNFLISQGSMDVGTYYLEVRGWSLRRTTGGYSLSVSGDARSTGTQLPAASAPSVTINAIPAGDEGTDAQLGAALTGGSYDGAPDHAWSVSGGTLDNANLAAPTWTRPAVSADASHTVSLTVTVGGTGTNASNGSSDTASTSRNTQVRDVPVQLPPATAPSVSINAILAGNENATVQLGAALSGGAYDGAAEYDWSVDGGTLDNANAAAPTWTRPSVTSDANRTVSLTITVRGTGATARSGTSDTASASRSAEVRDAGDHGNDRASATLVGIPSTTAGTLARRDRDWFRIEVGQAGTLRLETRSGIDTYGTLHRSDGSKVAENDDGGSNYNFRISRSSVGVGTYYLQVRGYNGSTRGDYSLEVSGTARAPGTVPLAAAPSVTIDAVPAGDEGTDAQLGAALDGGTYDGAAEYAWIVDGGTLDDPASATPTWTRPTVDGDANRTVSLAVTVRGTGAAAVSGSSDTARASRSALVRDVAAAPAATAPSVSINAIPAGDEGTDVQLGATLDGGTYDGAPEYAWSVDGGALDDPASATPTWTRPSVDGDANRTVSLTVTVRGAGTNAGSGTSATARANRQAEVRNLLPMATAPTVTIDAIPAGDEGGTVRLGATVNGGTYDGAAEYAWSVDGGTLNDPASATPTWTCPTVDADTDHTVRLTVTVRGSGTAARSGTSASANASQTAQVRDVAALLPVAAAPAVSINAILAGDEGTNVQLGAALSGGTYDGWAEYAWSVDGGTLDDPASATPTWTRPAVEADAGHTVSLTVTVEGSGTTARSGTSDSASTTRSAQVRKASGDDHGDDRASATVVGIPSTTAGELERGDRDWFRIDVGHAGTLLVESTGGTDTYGSLHRSDGSRIARNDDGGDRFNFRISRDALDVGAYYLQVRGFNSSTHGDYSLEVSGTARGPDSLPVAAAPSVSINAIADGDEGTEVQLGAALDGGAYDGAAEYAWSVDGGTLDDPASATPTWTRPTVNGDADHVVRLTVTVRGSGTTAESGSSATASANRSAKVRDGLPAATPPSVVMNVPGAGDERSAVQLSATLTGGTYDATEYAWTVNGGSRGLDDASSATPTWTRPPVSADTTAFLIVSVTVRGTGTNARNGTSAERRAAVSVTVRDVPLPVADAPNLTINAIPAGDEGTNVTLGAALAGGTYDGTPEYAWSVDGGTLDDPASATPTWTRPTLEADANHRVDLTVTVRGSGTTARSGTSATVNANRLAEVRAVAVLLPAAAAPALAIDAIPVGDEGTSVQLSAALSGGTYDGAPEYAWSVDGGTLDDPASATPTWTRPTVYAETSHTASLTVGVRGTGTIARSTTSATANASRLARVRNTNTDDHGNDQASATPVGIPSTMAGELGIDDRDYFRIEVSQSGTLAFETTGPTDTYGKLFRDGEARVDDDDSGNGNNFRISGVGVRPGVYYLQVRGSASSNTGPYNLKVSGTARGPAVLPVAAAPSLSIGAIAAGDEGSAVQLGAALAGGTYDGAPEYAWTVDGGTLDDATVARPTWRRPAVSADTSYTARLTVTVKGSDVAVRNGTSATASATQSALVRDVSSSLPVSAAPSVSIHAIAAGNEGAEVQLGAVLADGTYDGAPQYAWSLDGGTLDDATSATPTWTRPAVNADASYTVRLTVTVYGNGANARNGTSAAAHASQSAEVRDDQMLLPLAEAPTVAVNAVPAGTERHGVTLGATLKGGTYDGDPKYEWTVDGNIAHRGLLITTNGRTDQPTWIRPSVQSDTHLTVRLTVTVRGTGTNARRSTNDRVVASRETLVLALPAPVAVAPNVRINAIPAGDENASVQLGAAVDGGVYDRLGYAWSVDGGTLDNASSATPTWTRPAVTADAVQAVSLRITARGTGAAARSGSLDTAYASRSAQVRNVGAVDSGTLPAVKPPSVSVNYIPQGEGGTTVQLGVTTEGGLYDGAPTYAWSVDGGTLDDPSSATPTLTRPTVASNIDYLASVTVTVEGTGQNARSGSSSSVTKSRPFRAHPDGAPGDGDDHGNGLNTATVVTPPGSVTGRIQGNGDLDVFRFRLDSAANVVVESTGETDTVGRLFKLDHDGRPIATDDNSGLRRNCGGLATCPGANFKIARELEAGDYFVEVRGTSFYTWGDYVLRVNTPPPNRAPRLLDGLSSGRTYTVGGAAVLARINWKVSDPDGDYVWLEASSNNESVATVALEGQRLVVYPHNEGWAKITLTARDPHGASSRGSYHVHVKEPTATDPTAAFNATGDTLTLSFTDRIRANKTYDYEVAVRQKSPRSNWRRFCFSASNSSDTAQTVNVSTDLPMTGVAEPGVVYEAVYQHTGSPGSCENPPFIQFWNIDRDWEWSRPAEATAPGTASFDIDLVFVGTPPAALRTAVEEAAQYWERALTMGVPNVDFSRGPLNCMSGAPQVADVVDDLRLFVKIESIDGPGGVGASLTTCAKRAVSGMPSVAKMTLDADNYGSSSAARVRQVAVHEIAHALGFLGDNWRPAHLLRNPSLPVDPAQSNPPDTHFAGSRAIAAFDAAGGSSYADGKVPVENRIGGSGGQDSHWREDVMGNELMTPRLGSGSNPLSAITIQALADMGYHVDVSQAESYQLPSGSVSISAKRGHAHADPGECVVEDAAPTAEDGPRVVLNLKPSAVRVQRAREQ